MHRGRNVQAVVAHNMKQGAAHVFVGVINALAVNGLSQRNAVAVKDRACLSKSAVAGNVGVVGLIDPVVGTHNKLCRKKSDSADKSQSYY